MDKIKYSLQVLFIFIKSNIKILIPTSLMILLLPIIFLQTQKPKSLSSSADTIKCMPMKKLEIHPGKIITYKNGESINISTLAYDYKDKPINNGITYKWGISSSNSIGNLMSNKDLATFIPKKVGIGNIYVYAKNNCSNRMVHKSINVRVRKIKK